MTIARRRAVDHIRRARRQERTAEHLAHELRRLPEEVGDGDHDDGERDREHERDDTLRLMFLTCHPVLPPPARVALTLKLLGGLSAAEIARAFLVPEPVIVRRIAEAKRTLWTLLHESAAPVATVLSLNVEDLDLDDRRARVGRTWGTWRSRTARLLPDLIAGRTSGPLFLSERRPAPARAPAPEDLCPHTGRRRLSYERAEYLFKQATRRLDPAGNGFTLSRLRARDTPTGGS